MKIIILLELLLNKIYSNFGREYLLYYILLLVQLIVNYFISSL
jgi:hypothetical protein